MVTMFKSKYEVPHAPTGAKSSDMNLHAHHAGLINDT